MQTVANLANQYLSIFFLGHENIEIKICGDETELILFFE